MACDGLQALRHAANFEVITDSKAPQFDLLTATRATLRNCPISLTFRHVKGHQDDGFDVSLDEWARLNIVMDDEAKIHWHKCNDQRRPPPYIYGEPWPFWVAGNKVSKDVELTIADHIEGSKLCDYWESKGRFGDSSSEQVHWDAVATAMAAEGRSRRQWVVKHSSGFCGTGKMMQRWKLQESAKCPRCEEGVEDARHVWVCKGDGVENVWNEAIKKLRQWMLRQKTLPNLVAVICDRLSSWRNSVNPSVAISPFLGLRGAVQAQDLWGGGHFWKVSLSKDGQRCNSDITNIFRVGGRVNGGCQL